MLKLTQKNTTLIMFEQVLKSIQKFAEFSQKERSLFTKKLKIKKVEKDDFLLRPGQVCNSIYFINCGAFRYYFRTNDFIERTLNLYIENDWVFDHQSFTSQKPSFNYIQAFEPGEIFELDIYSLHELIERYNSFFKLGNLLVSVQDADFLLTEKSPDEKYKFILTNRPQLLHRFPLKYIASYLRITPETLSRVRRKMIHR